MRSLLARSDDPVSVMSMIASTRSGTLTSVAPQENSSSTFTPARSKNLLVIPMASVATRLPSRSRTSLMGESSGTTRTHRVGRALALLKESSVNSRTSDSFSATQSRPVIPASRYPCSTYRLISCARSNRISISGSSIAGRYERWDPEIEKPALANRLMVASIRLPEGRPRVRVRDDMGTRINDQFFASRKGKSGLSLGAPGRHGPRAAILAPSGCLAGQSKRTRRPEPPGTESPPEEVARHGKMWSISASR